MADVAGVHQTQESGRKSPEDNNAEQDQPIGAEGGSPAANQTPPTVPNMATDDTPAKKSKTEDPEANNLDRQTEAGSGPATVGSDEMNVVGEEPKAGTDERVNGEPGQPESAERTNDDRPQQAAVAEEVEVTEERVGTVKDFLEQERFCGVANHFYYIDENGTKRHFLTSQHKHYQHGVYSVGVIYCVIRDGKRVVTESFYKLNEDGIQDPKMGPDELGMLAHIEPTGLFKVNDPRYPDSEYDRDTAIDRARRRFVYPDFSKHEYGEENEEFAKYIGLIDYDDEDERWDLDMTAPGDLIGPGVLIANACSSARSPACVVS